MPIASASSSNTGIVNPGFDSLSSFASQEVKIKNVSISRDIPSASLTRNFSSQPARSELRTEPQFDEVSMNGSASGSDYQRLIPAERLNIKDTANKMISTVCDHLERPIVAVAGVVFDPMDRGFGILNTAYSLYKVKDNLLDLRSHGSKKGDRLYTITHCIRVLKKKGIEIGPILMSEGINADNFNKVITEIREKSIKNDKYCSHNEYKTYALGVLEEQMQQALNIPSAENIQKPRIEQHSLKQDDIEQQFDKFAIDRSKL